MKKLLALVLSVLLVVSVCGACASAEEEKVLNVFTWALYFDYDTLLAPFTEETGIKVNYDYFDSNEEMLMKLEAVDAGTYDVVLASDYILDIARKEGLLLELDKEKLPNWQNLNPAFLGQFYDPDDAYCMPYVAGTPLIIYDPEYVDFPITGYESLWDERLEDSVVMMDDARNVIGITLKTMGESFNTTDPEILAKAEEKLMQLKKNIRALDYNAPYATMISGEAIVGYMFNQQVLYTLQERPELEIVYPKEGLGFGIDCCVIPKNAPHPDNAHTFLNFLMRPENGAAIAEAQLMLSCNQAAEPYLSEEFKQNPVLNVPSELLENAEFIQDVGDAQTLYMDIWTRFKQY